MILGVAKIKVMMTMMSVIMVGCEGCMATSARQDPAFNKLSLTAKEASDLS